LNYVGQSVKELPRNFEAAAPYLKKDLEKTWNHVAGTMTVYGEQIGISEPSHPLAMAEEAREKLISGENFEEVVAEAQKELTTEDLKEVPSSNLAALNGVLPFEIDLAKCGGNLAEVLNSLDVGQVSAILKSKAGYHLIKLIDRDGAKVKIGHIVFEIKPETETAEEPAVKDADAGGPLKEAIAKLTQAIANGK
ncbi:MAG: peptidylprolyl isomerase, partial [bacterium]